jgi:hypothetical protein
MTRPDYVASHSRCPLPPNAQLTGPTLGLGRQGRTCCADSGATASSAARLATMQFITVRDYRQARAHRATCRHPHSSCWRLAPRPLSAPAARAAPRFGRSSRGRVARRRSASEAVREVNGGLCEQHPQSPQSAPSYAIASEADEGPYFLGGTREAQECLAFEPVPPFPPFSSLRHNGLTRGSAGARDGLA